MVSKKTQQLPILQWPTKAKRPKGIIFIVHGLMEHSLRYRPLIQEFNKHGYHVASVELPGHGTFASANGQLGTLPLVQGWKKIIEAIHTSIIYLKEYYPNLPIVLLGHSLGAFISTCYVAQYPNSVQKLILSASTLDRSPMPILGRGLAHILSAFGGSQRKSPLLHTLCFLGFNSNFLPNRTEFDWLCSDPEVVDDYINDPTCGFVCSRAYYAALFKLIRLASKASTLKRIPTSLPILNIAGDQDPLSKGGTRVQILHNELLKLKKNVDTRLIKGERHEPLLGTQKHAIMGSILKFLRPELAN